MVDLLKLIEEELEKIKLEDIAEPTTPVQPGEKVIAVLSKKADRLEDVVRFKKLYHLKEVAIQQVKSATEKIEEAAESTKVGADPKEFHKAAKKFYLAVRMQETVEMLCFSSLIFTFIDHLVQVPGGIIELRQG
ncbi:MAG: hypothetical protein COU22_03555, partial [Candidatus Komeilibacteria bacterium CG10_big_fil_rev_8_21_14_0_10_41_13]